MLILDGGRYMSSDQLGGAYGFEVIKEECLKLIEGLPPTAVFNVVVYDGTLSLFSEMVSAKPQNVEKAKVWLMPLNQVMGAVTKYGVDTLPPVGNPPKGSYPFGKFKDDIFYPRGWNEPVFLGVQQRADIVFLLTGEWVFFVYDLEDNGALRRQWNDTSAGRDWVRKVSEGREALKEENAKRKAAGEPPSALNGSSELEVVRHYYPGTQEPPHGERVYMDTQDLVKAFVEAYKAYAKTAPRVGLKKSSGAEFKLNVIFFAPEKPENEGSAKRMEDDTIRKLIVMRTGGNAMEPHSRCMTVSRGFMPSGPMNLH